MFGITQINWENTAENLVLIIVSVFVGAIIGYYASIFTAEKMIEQMTPTIKEAILKETTKIENKIDLQIDKIKKSETIDINVNQTPKNEIEQKKVSVKNNDTVRKNKTWFGRTFFPKK